LEPDQVRAENDIKGERKDNNRTKNEVGVYWPLPITHRIRLGNTGYGFVHHVTAAPSKTPDPSLVHAVCGIRNQFKAAEMYIVAFTLY
jgi:hypothetical protein